MAPYQLYDDAMPSWPDAVAIGDVTGDGRDDAILATAVYFQEDKDYSLFIYPQTSAGNLIPPIKLPYLGTVQGGGTVRLQLADLDHDGIKDIIVGHDQGVTIFHARGSGRFSTNVITLSGVQSSSMAVADINQDGNTDVLWQNSDGVLSILMGTGHGDFAPPRSFVANSAWHQAFKIADVTGDSIPDLIFSNQLSLAVYPGNGTGNFLSPRIYPYPVESDSRGFDGLAVIDVNHDGRNDILTSTSGNRPNALIWTYYQSASGGLSQPSNFQTFDSPEVLVPSDLDLDGYQDMLVMHSGWYALGYYLRHQEGWFQELGAYVNYATHFNQDGVATGDLNGDGCTDSAIANYNLGLMVLPGLNCFEPWKLINQRTGDFDGDGKSDILWHNVANGANVIWKSGNSNEQISVTQITDTNWQIAGIGDFNGDGKADILWRHPPTGKNAIWPSGQFASRTNLQTINGTGWNIVGIGDFDGNGKDDILWHNEYAGMNSLWPDGLYTRRKSLATVKDTDWLVVGIGDFDGDSRSDILWRNRRTGDNVIWLGANYANSQHVENVPSLGWQVAGIGDFNRDGRSDILWHFAFNGQNVLWYSGINTTSALVSRASSIAWKVAGIGDYDHDGRADILWRQNQSGANAIWRSGNSSTPMSVTGVTRMSWKAI
jgi:hypothetical protein